MLCTRLGFRARLHALADALHLAGARDRLGALVRLLQLALPVPDAPQQPLHVPAAALNGACTVYMKPCRIALAGHHSRQ